MGCLCENRKSASLQRKAYATASYRLRSHCGDDEEASEDGHCGGLSQVTGDRGGGSFGNLPLGAGLSRVGRDDLTSRREGFVANCGGTVRERRGRVDGRV